MRAPLCKVIKYSILSITQFARMRKRDKQILPGFYIALDESGGWGEYPECYPERSLLGEYQNKIQNSFRSNFLFNLQKSELAC